MAKSNDTTLYTYNTTATAKCTNCGMVYGLGSTIASFSTEICGNCHPFYTGKEVLVDTAGRIEKFNARMSKASDTQVIKKAKVRKSVQSIGELMVDEPIEESKPKVEKQVEKPKTPIAKAVESQVETIVETTEVQSASSVTQTATSTGGDDLAKIEGIGPKIAELLSANSIATFAQLAATDVEVIRTLLSDNKLGGHEPTTWGQQAELAANGKWEELATLQKELDGGK
jgi:ribosomal protein L31